MVKSKIVRATAVAVTSLGAVAACAGIAGASTGSLDHTGPDSSNNVKSITTSHVTLNNDNNIHASSSNSQWASTGNAITVHNTTAGGAMTGDATNNNSVGATVSLSNSMPSMASSMDPSSDSGTISFSGPSSDNKIVSVNKSTVNVDNDNNVSLSTSSHQSAETGKAVVAGNTTGGSATTGDATNSNSGTFTITVTN